MSHNLPGLEGLIQREKPVEAAVIAEMNALKRQDTSLGQRIKPTHELHGIVGRQRMQIPTGRIVAQEVLFDGVEYIYPAVGYEKSAHLEVFARAVPPHADGTQEFSRFVENKQALSSPAVLSLQVKRAFVCHHTRHIPHEALRLALQRNTGDLHPTRNLGFCRRTLLQ